MTKDITKAEALVREQLIFIGENPDREGLVDTPKRVVKIAKPVTMVMVRELSFCFSLCVFMDSTTDIIIESEFKRNYYTKVLIQREA